MSTAVYNQNYKRSVNKAAIPTCNIMGVDIAAVDIKLFCIVEIMRN